MKSKLVFILFLSSIFFAILSSIYIFSASADITSSLLSHYRLDEGSGTTAKKRSALVKASGESVIYYINSLGIKKPVPDGKVFYSYNNKLENVQTITKEELNSYPNFHGISYLNKVYLLESNLKRLVPSIEVFNKLKLDWTKIVPVNQVEWEYYGVGSVVQ